MLITISLKYDWANVILCDQQAKAVSFSIAFPIISA